METPTTDVTVLHPVVEPEPADDPVVEPEAAPVEEHLDEVAPPENRVAAWDFDALREKIVVPERASQNRQATTPVRTGGFFDAAVASMTPEELADSDRRNRLSAERIAFLESQGIDPEADEEDGFGVNERHSVPVPLSAPPVPLAPPAAPGKSTGGYQQADETLLAIKNIEDMHAEFPIGDGVHFIRVERKVPRIWRGLPIAGVQRPVMSPTTEQQFSADYGAGQYQLTVYGPSKTNILDANGRRKMRALTKPITMTVPNPFGDNPPNIEMANVLTSDGPYEDDYEVVDGDNMNEPILRPRRSFVPQTTDADAAIHAATLDHDIEKKKLERELEKEKRQEDLDLEERRARLRNEEEERQRKLIDEKNDEIERLKRRPMEEGMGMLGGVAQLMGALRPTEASGEVERLREAIHHDRDAHRNELENMRRAHDDALRRERERADEMIRREQDSARNRIEEVERNARDRVEDMRRQNDTRVSEMQMTWQARLDDERRQHDRDLNNRGALGETQSLSLRTTFEMQINMKDQEIGRLREEAAHLDRLLEEERSKSLADRLEEAEHIAEALGYEKGGEDGKGWKETLAEGFMGLAAQAPQLLGSLAAAGQQQQAARPMQAAPRQLGGGVAIPGGRPGPRFATEDMDLPPMGDAPFSPHMAPFQAQPFNPQQPIITSGEMMPAQQPEPMPAKQTPPPGIPPGTVVQFAEQFREALDEGKTADEVCDQIVAEAGIPSVKGILNMVTLQYVIESLEAQDPNEEDPLLRVEGREFLGDIFKGLKARTS